VQNAAMRNRRARWATTRLPHCKESPRMPFATTGANSLKVSVLRMVRWCAVKQIAVLLNPANVTSAETTLRGVQERLDTLRLCLVKIAARVGEMKTMIITRWRESRASSRNRRGTRTSHHSRQPANPLQSARCPPPVTKRRVREAAPTFFAAPSLRGF
jgi:hypothetical protein